MATICLCMIVRDESAVIERCLLSVRGLIDAWVICDTGSKDDTADRLKRVLDGIPGELHHRPWKDFAHNRSELMRLAEGKADYLLTLDADMTVDVERPFKDELTADAYLIRYAGDIDYHQVMLVSSRHRWEYVGVTHEHITSPTAQREERLPQLTLTHHCDGGMRHLKLTRDVELLTDGLRRDPGNRRYMFYLANTYRDAGRLEEALEWYGRRAAAGGWVEEVWYSKFQIGCLKESLGREWAECMAGYLAAHDFRPARAEALYRMARHYRVEEAYNTAYVFSRAAMAIPYPDDLLFIERPVYRYLLPMEHAICCYWVGRHEEAIAVNRAILDLGAEVPAGVLEQVRKNLAFSERILGSGARGPQPGVSDAPLAGRKVFVLSYSLGELGGTGVSLRALLERLEIAGAEIRAGGQVPTVDEIHAWAPDFVMSEQWATPLGHVLAQHANAPFIMLVHGPQQFEAFFDDARDCDLVIFNSRNQQELLEAVHPDLPGVVVHPIVRENDYLSPPELRRADHVACIGTDPQKGQHIFVELARRCTSENFMMVGNVAGAFPRVPRNLTIIGRTPDMKSVYSQTRVLVMPSQVESYGRVAVEAAVMGIPTIATDLPGIREATEGKAVYVRDREDLDAWERALRAVLRDLDGHRERARQLWAAKRPQQQVDELIRGMIRLIR